MRKNAYILLAALGLASCNYLEIEPVGKVIPHKTSEYRALLTEGYSRFPYTSSKAYTGLLSDEVGMFHEGNFFDSSDAIALSYNYTWQYETQMWEYPYQYYYRAAFQANAVIDGVADADDDSSEDKRQILGEAHAMRAYAHFDLVNLYGKPYDPQTASTDRGVPLSTYIDIEQKYRPTNVAAVYRQIVEDIEAAEPLFSDQPPFHRRLRRHPGDDTLLGQPNQGGAPPAPRRRRGGVRQHRPRARFQAVAEPVALQAISHKTLRERIFRIIPAIFDFKRVSFAHREKRSGWVVLEVHSIRPVRGMCGNSRL